MIALIAAANFPRKCIERHARVHTEIVGEIGEWLVADVDTRIAVTGFRRRSDTEPMRMLALVRNFAKVAREYVVTATFRDDDGNERWGANVQPAADGRTLPLPSNASIRMDWELPERPFHATHVIFRFRRATTLAPLPASIRVPIVPLSR